MPRRGRTRVVTEQAKELADFVEYLNKSDDVTVLYVIEAYRGAKLQEIKEHGHDKFWFYSSGGNNRFGVNKLLVHLVLEGVFKVRRNTNTGDPVIDFLTAYITTNPRHYLMNCHYRYNHSRDYWYGELYHDDYDYPVDEIRIPRGPAETWISPLSSTSSISSSKSATVTVEHNMGHPKLALIREQCRDALLKKFLKMTVKRRTKLSCIENLPAIKSMSDVLPKTKDELMKIQNVTEANFEEFGEILLNITKKYRNEADKLKPLSLSENDSSVFHFEDSDLDMKSGQNSVDANLKSSCGDGDRAEKVKPSSNTDSSEFDFDSNSEMNSSDAKRKCSCSNEDKADELEPSVPSDSVFDFDSNDSEMKNGHQNSSDAKRKSSYGDGDKPYKVKPPSDSDSSVFDFDDSDSEMKSGQNSLDAKRKSFFGDNGNRADKVKSSPSDSDSSVFDFDSDSEMKSSQNSNDAKRKSSCGDEGDTKRLKKYR